MTDLLTADQLAERLKVRPSTVREWAKSGPCASSSPSSRRRDATKKSSAVGIPLPNWQHHYYDENR